MTTEERPNPDLLLEKISSEENKNNYGKLKIFFGYAAGVGKTYAMLEAAHAALQQGIDVVAGYIEPHTRPETLALLEGLEQQPVLEIKYKDIILKEFDIDRAIIRKPKLILVDELAHTNAEACRHKKRCQDIEELLHAGIDVYTTVNVQHIESLNDIVASITGVIVKERINDNIFDEADSVELVDIEPDELLERLEKGKVYRKQQAHKAMQNFFTKQNLIALREIALRRTADRINLISEKNKQSIGQGDYFTDEHILICLSPAPSNGKVIRTASRMARAFHGQFTALFVETSRFSSYTEEDKKRLKENLRLAEQMGAKIATVYGDDVAVQIAEYARMSGVSKVILGRSMRRFWFLSKQTFSEKLTVLAPNLDIYIIPDKQDSPRGMQHRSGKNKIEFQLSPIELLKMILILSIATALGFCFKGIGFSEANIITIYILSVLLTAIISKDRIYSLISSVLSVLIFNYFFTEPRFTLEVYDSGYPITFIIMFAAAFISGTLATRVKKHALESSRQAYRTGILLDTSRKLQMAEDYDAILKTISEQLIKLLDKTLVFYPVRENELGNPVVFQSDNTLKDTEKYVKEDERAVAAWVFKNNKHAGATTETLPGAKSLYLAIRNNNTVLAVLGICLEGESLEPPVKGLLISMLGECALAMEKERIIRVQKETAIRAQQEQFRSNLLRSISHDLRTPLTSISGNSSILIGNSMTLSEEKKQQLYTDIYDDSIWLINLVENLLSVTRIENGSMVIHKETELVYDIIMESLKHIDRRSKGYKIHVNMQDELIMAKMDARLMMQVFINIVDNAIKYTPEGSAIDITVHKIKKKVCIEISDNGEGIQDDVKARLFDMFYTGSNAVADSRRGMGLGLTLCKSIIEAHDGTIEVKDHKPQGTKFVFTLHAEEVKAYG